jgi:hypothetical protein
MVFVFWVIGLGILLGCLIAAVGTVIVLISEWQLGRRVQRSVASATCPACGKGPLTVTANLFWPEQEGYHCRIRLEDRHVCCRACGAAFLAAPVGTFAVATAAQTGEFELVTVEPAELQRGLAQRRAICGRLAALVAGAWAVLGLVFAVAPLCGLPAIESTLVVFLAMLLFCRQLPGLVGARRKNNRAA